MAFGSISATRAAPPRLLPSPMSLNFPSFSAPTLFGFAFGVLGGERKEQGPQCPSPCRCLLELHFVPFSFSVVPPPPPPLLLLSSPASVSLPAGVADPLSHPILQAAGQVGRCQP